MTIISSSPEFLPFFTALSFSSKFNVAATTVIIYDYGLVFSREVELVWRHSWSLITFLYLIARYVGLMVALLNIWGASSVTFTDSEYVPPATHYVQVPWLMRALGTWAMDVLVFVMHAIMAIRVFAMYSQSKKMRIFLALCFLAATVSRGAMDTLATAGAISEGLIIFGRGVCIEPTSTVKPYFVSIPNICVELIFFLLAAWVFVKHVREIQRALPDWGYGDCLAILFRDHLLQFFCYLISNVMEISISATKKNSTGSWWFSSFAMFFVTIQQCVLIPRLVISIREYHNELQPKLESIQLGTISFLDNRHVIL